MRVSNRTVFGALCAVLATTFCQAKSVSNTILVVARDDASAQSGTSGLQGYGIPYQVLIVPPGGTSLPPLNTSATEGNYGGILVLGEAAYEYPTGWASAITLQQWQTIYEYQLSFGVRMVRLDSFPSTDLGTDMNPDLRLVCVLFH